MAKALTLAVALTMALAAVPPAAGLLVRSFPDVAGGADFGYGIGLYDPGTVYYCLAEFQVYTGVSPVMWYYTGLRYWPDAAASTGSIPLGVGLPDPTGCAGQLPTNEVAVDSLQADAGLGFWVYDLLHPGDVAVLSTVTMEVQYCQASLYAAPGPVGLRSSVVELFSAGAVACASPGSDLLYPDAEPCPTFRLNTAPGQLEASGPVFLPNRLAGVVGEPCNTLQDVPAAGDFVAQRCVSLSTFSTIDGGVRPGVDSDFFVVGRDGALLAWATAFGTPPDPLFPHVSNLASHDDCTSGGFPSYCLPALCHVWEPIASK